VAFSVVFVVGDTILVSVVDIVEVTSVADWNLLIVISDADWNLLTVISDADWNILVVF
jgi:hypothetical protein